MNMHYLVDKFYIIHYFIFLWMCLNQYLFYLMLRWILGNFHRTHRTYVASENNKSPQITSLLTKEVIYPFEIT